MCVQLTSASVPHILLENWSALPVEIKIHFVFTAKLLFESTEFHVFQLPPVWSCSHVLLVPLFRLGEKNSTRTAFSLALQTQKLCNKAKGFHGVCSKGSFKIEQENFLRFWSFTYGRSAHKIDFSIFSRESASASRIISIVITCFKPVSTLFIAHLPILLSVSLIELSSSFIFLAEHLINIIFSDFTGRCFTNKKVW